MSASVAKPIPARPRASGAAAQPTRPGTDSYRFPPDRIAIAARNVCALHALERLAARFNAAGIPLLLLKGAALHLALYERPEDRAMSDVDVLVRPTDLPAINGILAELDARYGAPLVRADFFPRYYYEREVMLGPIFPTRLDLHVRPFRPLRYASTVPPNAFWDHAQATRLGQATVLIPDPTDMLLHLTTHAAIHGSTSRAWMTDIVRWIERYTDEIDWDRLVDRATCWRLALPVREILVHVQGSAPSVELTDVITRLRRVRVNWRDRLTLRHAPRDNTDPAGHVLTSVLTTPDLPHAAGFMTALLLPDRPHMESWYPHRHPGWLAVAHLARWLGPVTRPWQRRAEAKRA